MPIEASGVAFDATKTETLTIGKSIEAIDINRRMLLEAQVILYTSLSCPLLPNTHSSIQRSSASSGTTNYLSHQVYNSSDSCRNSLTPF